MKKTTEPDNVVTPDRPKVNKAEQTVTGEEPAVDGEIDASGVSGPLGQSRPITIRMNLLQLKALKQMAAVHGLAYQTYMKSLIQRGMNADAKAYQENQLSRQRGADGRRDDV